MWSRRLLLLGAAATLLIIPNVANAQSAGDSVGTIEVASPRLRGDGTMSAAAAAAMNRGALWLDADRALKRTANRAASRSGVGPLLPSELAQVGGSRKRNAPIVVSALNFAGQTDSGSTPPDTTGAIGTTRFIQLVNRRFGIYNRSTGALISSGTLNTLAGLASSVNSFDPQIIWDRSTNRFYYVMDSVFSSTNNKLAFGFSRTSSPSNGTTDWCHYTYTPLDAARFPDYPKLGDSRYFIIIGVNSFKPNFVGSDLIAISKPPSGSTCPMEIFKAGTVLNLRDTANAQVFTPVPANQVDTSSTGYVVARNLALPSTRLWFYNVTRNSSTGFPIFGGPRGVTVTSYTVPPDANQPPNNPPFGYNPLLDTLDARPTQAVQGVNPDRGTFSFWTQHTIKHPTQNVAAVRWYEINPAPAVPVILRTANVQSNTAHLFNAAISSDRTGSAFGDSFVVQYSVSSSTISPRIVAGSSFSGGALSFLLVRNGVGPYRDFSCPNAGDPFCRWGDYSGATPDPLPPRNRPRLDRGAVWGTNQFSGVANPSAATANWRTQIFNLQP
jgi:hypothetical protein